MKLIPATSAPYGNLSDWLMPTTGSSARIHRLTVIIEGASIGEGAVIRAGAVIHAGVVIGEWADIVAGALIEAGAKIGDWVVIETDVRGRPTSNMEKKS